MKNSKHNYSSSLRKLESISDEIHELRKSQLDLAGPRQDGVGAECSIEPFEGESSTDDDFYQPKSSSEEKPESNAYADVHKTTQSQDLVECTSLSTTSWNLRL